MFKPSEEFEIDVIIKNLENNIRKYNPDYSANEEKSVLKNINQNEDRKSINNVEVNTNPEKDTVNSNNGGVNVEENKEQTPTLNVNSSVVYHSPDKKKGLFSMVKSALGFSKGGRMDTNNLNKKGNDENVDLQILSAAIDTIFINSSSYEESTIKDITRAFLESSKTLVEGNQNMNDNIITYIHFNLTKLLELSVINVKRIHTFWDIIVATVNYITSKNLTNISRFALDVLTIIDLFILAQYKIEGNEFTDWTYENWQKTLLIPYKTVGNNNISQNINLNIIYNLSKILQNCGQVLNASGWTNYIEICQILISKSDEMLCDNSNLII
jgi:hypothetical protein